MDVTAIPTYLSSYQLFVLNGAVEGLVALICIFNPALMLNVKGLHKHGHFFAGFFGPMLFGQSLISVLMARLSDDDAKLLFAFGWVMYHFGAGTNCFKQFIGGKRAMIGGLLFHSFMMASFGFYLKTNDFNVRLLMPF